MEDHIMRGRWLYTVTVGYDLIVLAYDLTHHIMSRWSLGPLVFIPIAVKAWRLRYRRWLDRLVDTGFGYDGAGSPTTYRGQSLAFDPENRMTQYGPAAGPTQADGYDASGLRAWKQAEVSPTGIDFLWDGTQPVEGYCRAERWTRSKSGPNDMMTGPDGFSTFGFVSVLILLLR